MAGMKKGCGNGRLTHQSRAPCHFQVESHLIAFVNKERRQWSEDYWRLPRSTIEACDEVCLTVPSVGRMSKL